ncbi:hypothetical protein OUZ56_015943 [Daphnia magna]|uniref:Uncharacterized protein n=1 Tax=Daphnia magna TaxID=35525 RepID=A0ABR0APE4_9CRUS|nr:hypothetical protein OUZ56_015943 [Daphnia magna]
MKIEEEMKKRGIQNLKEKKNKQLCYVDCCISEIVKVRHFVCSGGEFKLGGPLLCSCEDKQ